MKTEFPRFGLTPSVHLQSILHLHVKIVFVDFFLPAIKRYKYYNKIVKIKAI
jgi:hypothetical protein